MFHIHYRKHGGLRFLTLGRITISWSVTSPEAWFARLEKKLDAETMKALVSVL